MAQHQCGSKGVDSYNNFYCAKVSAHELSLSLCLFVSKLRFVQHARACVVGLRCSLPPLLKVSASFAQEALQTISSISTTANENQQELALVKGQM